MGLFDFLRGKKAGSEAETSGDGFIRFDNLTFKLAVIQELMYEQKLLSSIGEFGDQFFEKYPDYASVDESEEIKRLEAWSKDILSRYEELKIPAGLAPNVKKIYVGEENSVYYNVNPQWQDYDDHFENGKMFMITDVSEEEMKQFPNLKTFIFNMYDAPSPELVAKLKKHGCEVEAND